MNKISWIVPCYNEEKTVSLMYKEIKKTFANEKVKHEIIFVNDGSADGTDVEIKKVLEKSDDVIYINFSRNFGKEAAMYAGLEHASGDFTTIIDGDLQQHPSVVLQMYKELLKDSSLDCVATYQAKRNESFLKAFLSKCFYGVANHFVSIDLANSASDFRLFKTNVRKAMLSFCEHKRFTKGIFSWVGFNVKYIEYEPLKRQYGQTKWRLKSLFSYALDGIFPYSEKILLLPFHIANLSLIASIVILVLSLIKSWALIYFLVLLLFALNAYIIGIVAIYISRVYIEVQNRPIYIAKEVINTTKEK